MSLYAVPMNDNTQEEGLVFYDNWFSIPEEVASKFVKVKITESHSFSSDQRLANILGPEEAFGKDTFGYMCGECKLVFSSLQDYDYHMQQVHGIIRQNIIETSDYHIANAAKIKEKNLKNVSERGKNHSELENDSTWQKFKKCGEKFLSTEELTQMKQRKKLRNTIKFQRDSISEPTAPKEYPCHYCCRVFFTHSSLYYHIKTEHSNK